MHHPRYPFRFDAAKAVGAFGGITETHKVLQAMGCKVTRGAVQKWTERGVVPAEAAIALHLYAAKNELGIGLHELMEE